MTTIAALHRESHTTSKSRPFLIIAFFILGVAIYVAGQHLMRPYTGFAFHWENGVVSIVDAEGPAARAGITPNDQVLELNGRVVRSEGDYYAGYRAGDTVIVTGRRGSETFTTPLILARPPAAILVTHSTLLILGLIFWVLGVWVYWQHQDVRVGRDFLLFCLGAALCIWAYPDADHQFEWARTSMYAGVSFCGTALLSLHTRFPVRLNLVWQRIGLVGYGIAIAITTAAIFIGPTRLGSLLENATGLSPWTPSLIVRGLFVVSAFLAMFLLGWVYWSGNGQARRRIRLIFFGTLLGLLPTIGVLAAEILEVFGLPGDLALISGIAIPVSYTISLRRNNLLTVETRLYQWTVTVVAVMTMAMLYLAFTALATRLFNLESHHAIIGALVVLTLLIFYGLIQNEIRRLISRIFYGPEFDYMDILAVSLQKLGNSTDEVTPIEVLTEDIPPALRVDKVGIWLREGDTLHWRGGTLQPIGKQQIDVSALTPRLKDGTPVADESGSWMPLTGEARWWVPLVMTGELQGLWVLGPRERDSNFSPVDQQFLTTAAHEAAMAIKVTHLLRDMREQLNQTEQAYREARLAYNQVVNVREKEQRRIATDLHDDVVQRIFALTQTLHGIRTLIGQEAQQSDELKYLMANAVSIASMVGERTRAICFNLRPPELRHGLVPALEALCQGLGDQGVVEVQLMVRPPTIQLDEEIESQIFRMVQEALNNIAKHANASLADVILTHDKQVLRLIISDDGVGFNIKTPRRTLGLDIIQERAKALGGLCIIDSDASDGTTITVEIPLSPDVGVAS